MDVFIKGDLARVKNQTRGIIIDVPRDPQDLPGILLYSEFNAMCISFMENGKVDMKACIIYQ